MAQAPSRVIDRRGLLADGHCPQPTARSRGGEAELPLAHIPGDSGRPRWRPVHRRTREAEPRPSRGLTQAGGNRDDGDLDAGGWLREKMGVTPRGTRAGEEGVGGLRRSVALLLWSKERRRGSGSPEPGGGRRRPWRPWRGQEGTRGRGGLSGSLLGERESERRPEKSSRGPLNRGVVVHYGRGLRRPRASTTKERGGRGRRGRQLAVPWTSRKPPGTRSLRPKLSGTLGWSSYSA